MADWEEAAGISAPLYDIVDTLFELQSRGFFRRQVCYAPHAPRAVEADMMVASQPSHVPQSSWDYFPTCPFLCVDQEPHKHGFSFKNGVFGSLNSLHASSFCWWQGSKKRPALNSREHVMTRSMKP